ncbi:CHASE3 domain-containing protein [Mycobacterium sp. PSTR-4-N]|uniref:CHASE3 domain-containing protein n=1 Tax=Mycobacterium sp. PSTR-4-N TaxID=2917745 RepID=UPI001F14C8BE|nr:CHASE3 domain-containing protein [Mycobacterium sp. PSTR-4-N]MCG7593005.1 CHASE3 domain-containing protein [Mycobacterium sp. PSTR-4-N]
MGTGNRQLSLRQLIWICLAVVSVVFLAVSAASILGRATVTRAVDELVGRVAPLQDEVEALRRAYTDQETGQRGYLLTGNPVSLQPYDAGTEAAASLTETLAARLAGNERGRELLAEVTAAAAHWRTQVAQPQIAARRSGPIAPEQQTAMTLEGKQQFDDLRAPLRDLAGYSSEMAQAQVRRIEDAQRVANVIQGVGVVVLVIVIIGGLTLVHRRLTRPVEDLLVEVTTVAAGDYDQPIHPTGPRETAELARAVEQMRLSLRASTNVLIDGELRDEQARIAADLHDRVIQRVFGLGLGLTSAAARRNPDLEGFIDETDAIIRDLREVVFNLHQSISAPVRSSRLRSAIIDVVEGSVGALGFTPALQFEGPVDDAHVRPPAHAAALAVVREALSNVARHARASTASVTVAVTGLDLRIIVRDNGIGISDNNTMGHGRANITSRAVTLGGSAKIYNASPGPGAVVEWAVPLDLP